MAAAAFCASLIEARIVGRLCHEPPMGPPEIVTDAAALRVRSVRLQPDPHYVVRLSTACELNQLS